MQAVVEKKEFMRTLARAGAAAQRKSQQAILTHVLLKVADGDLTVSATDLAIYYREALGAREAQPGSLSVTASRLLEIVKSAPTDDLYLSDDGDQLTVKSGRVTAKLDYLPEDDFPEEPETGKQAMLTISAGTLSDALAQVEPAISNEDDRFNLSNMFFEMDRQGGQLNLVATDGHRLHRLKLEATLEGLENLEGKGALIPGASIKALRRFLGLGGEAVLGLGERWSTLRISTAVAHFSTSEGSFPDYRVVIPKSNPHRALVKREEMGAAMERARVFASGRFMGASFEFENGLLTLQTQTPEVGELKEVLEVDCQGSFQSGLDVSFIDDAMKVMKSDQIGMATKGDGEPWMLEGEGDPGFLCVIMPMRL